MTITELKQTAVEVRKGIVTATHAAKSGHPGGSLSATEIFTYLYFEEMNIDPKNPKMEDRDRFVLSKGHTAPGLYSALANRGYFPVKDLEKKRGIFQIWPKQSPANIHKLLINCPRGVCIINYTDKIEKAYPSGGFLWRLLHFKM